MLVAILLSLFLGAVHFWNEKIFLLFLRLKEAHFSIFFLFIIGIVLTDFLKISLWKGLLFFVPIVFYAAVSRVSFEKVHIRLREQRFFRILLSLAVLLGVISAVVILKNTLLYHLLLAFITGSFLYIVIMDFVPREAKGRPEYFLLGASLYTLLISLTWIV